MENASKALIIAGAVLLSILLITFGYVIIRRVSPTLDRAGVDQQEVETFNSKIDHYVGARKTATDVRNLVSTVLSVNGSETRNATGHKIQINSKDVTTYPTNLSNGASYTINASTDANGYINNVTISPDPFGTGTTGN